VRSRNVYQSGGWDSGPAAGTHIFGKLTLPGDVTTNRATIVIGGQGEIVDFSDTPAHLNLNDTGGSFTVLNSQYNATRARSPIKARSSSSELLDVPRRRRLPAEFGSTKVDGTLIATEVDLNGGLLSGTGQIQADVYNNGGILAPGDSPGTITIAGNYHQGGRGPVKYRVRQYEFFRSGLHQWPCIPERSAQSAARFELRRRDGQQFLILSAFGITGDFSTFFSPYFANSKMFPRGGVRKPDLRRGHQCSGARDVDAVGLWFRYSWAMESRFHRPFND